MSARSFASLIKPLTHAAAEAAWKQWAHLFAARLHGASEAQSVVDPEALLLATLTLEKHERRLEKTMHVWLGTGSRLVSLSRLRNLAREQSPGVRAKLESVAAWSVAHGDRSWRAIAGTRTPSVVRLTTESPSPNVLGPGSLMLRMRMLFGVGIKADVLSYLLTGLGGHSVRDVAMATAYVPRAVRSALEDLAAAGAIKVRPTSPVSYQAEWARWGVLLGLAENSVPLWRYWRELYLTVARLDEWAVRADEAEWTAYVAFSKLRDTLEALAPMTAGRVHTSVDPWVGGQAEHRESVEAWIADMRERIESFV